MKAEDIIRQLQAVLPTVTTLFSDTLSIVSITPSGITATATTSVAHGLSVGDMITIEGTTAPIGIDTITRVDDVATVETTTDHDLTENFFDSVTLSGATETEFNGVFELLTVPNRRKFTIRVADSGPTTATGSPQLDEPGDPFGYNGRQTITDVPTTTTFEYTLPKTLNIPADVAGGLIHSGIRVTGSIDAERAIDLYTRKAPGELWAFVVLGDVNASKDRNTRNDSISGSGPGGSRRQQIFQTASIVVLSTVSTELSSRAARDLMEDVAIYLFKSIGQVKFATGLSAGQQTGLQFVSHGLLSYDSSVYAHQFNFEMLTDINDADTVDPELNVAFRDITFTMGNNTGTGLRSGSVDLDDEPI